MVGYHVRSDANEKCSLIDCAGSLGTQLLGGNPDQYTKCFMLLAK